MQSALNMTEGPIGKTMFKFAVPIFLGNLFQQLYNAADTLIVGNFLGSNALAAVGSTGSLILLLIGFFNGTAFGSGVVVAQYFGAQDDENLSRAVHTIVAFGILSGIFVSLVGVLATPYILKLINTPPHLQEMTATYLQIYFSGALGLILYNMFVGILQSVGDSRHPLIYLAISSVLNVILDIVFIRGLGFGVGAAAFATILSQFISALLCLRQLMTTDGPYRLYPRKLRLHRDMLIKVIHFGFPSGLQFSIVSLANVVVQSQINVFGEYAMAGTGAFQRIEQLGTLPINCFNQAASTFVGQNVGANRWDRAKKGARLSVGCAMLLAEISGLVIALFAPTLIGLFNSHPEVVAYGALQSRIMGPFFFLLAACHSLSSVCRGAGHPTGPTAILLSCWTAFRVTYLFIFIPIFHSILVVYWAYPITWTLSTLIFLFYLRKVKPLQPKIDRA